jgi:protein phosphatase
VLGATDVLGKRIIPTRLRGNITIREENAAAAFEVMSRFAVDPRWLIYLPATMSPCETSGLEGMLEHPAEAFAYFQKERATKAVCEVKHMGSRAVVIACRDQQSARERFGVTSGECGIVITRTGRRFFSDMSLERRFLDRIRAALTEAHLWRRFDTNWACLDCELMPWSAKAQELLRTHYAAVGAAGRASLPCAVHSLQKASERLLGTERDKLADVQARFLSREQNVARFVTAYRQYCWPVESLSELMLAPSHLLATEGHVHTDRDHLWHMETLSDLCQAAPDLLVPTVYKVMDLTDESSEREATAWWDELTDSGGKGMVVKPLTSSTPAAGVSASQRSSAAGVSISGSSLALTTRRPTILVVCGHARWGKSGRSPWRSFPWASRAWSASCAESHYGAYMSVFSACAPSRASRWTRGSRSWLIPPETIKLL